MHYLFNNIENFEKSDNEISFALEYREITIQYYSFTIILDKNELVVRCFHGYYDYEKRFTNSDFICRYFGEEKDKILNIPKYIFNILNKDNITKYITLKYDDFSWRLFLEIDIYILIDNNCLLNIELYETLIT
jgi:hypothetical protein